MSRRYGRIFDACFHSPSPSFMSTVSSVNRMLAASGSAPGVCATIAFRVLRDKAAEAFAIAVAAAAAPRCRINAHHLAARLVLAALAPT